MLNSHLILPQMHFIIKMSVINTANNAFTYNSIDSSSTYVYIANNIDDKIQFDNISANKYVSVIDNKMQSKYLTTYYLYNKNTVVINSNDKTVCSTTLQSSFSTVIVTTMVPLLIGDFTKITDSDSMTVSIKVKDTILASCSVPLAVQPVTMLNTTFTLTDVPAGYMNITARCTLPSKYIVGESSVNGNPFSNNNANTAVCIP